tara:strand:- start:103 stop:1479 length:1377 start_codon:yes stop_codon:yes gene_type:complete
MALGESVQYAGQYKLRECQLLSSTGLVARLDANVIEINLFENLFTQSIIGSLVVADQNNLIANMPIVGQEYISLKLETPGVGVIDYTDNVFCVQKVSSRKGFSVGSEVYELNLISPEALRNNRTRVSKSYKGTDSEIVTKVLKDEKLINTKKQIHVDETSRIRKYVAPNVRPNDFINYLTRESTSKKYGGSPHYFFYENVRGFNFRVLDSLYDQQPMGEFVAAENIVFERQSLDIEKDYRRVMNHSIVSSNDTLFTTRGGMLGSKLIKYNIFHKNYTENTFNYFDNFKDFGRIDENPIYNKVSIDEQDNTVGDFSDARIHLHPTSNNGTNDAQFYEDSSYSYSDNHAEDWILSRRSKMIEMSSGGLQVQLKVHGYCNIAVGEKILLSLPISGIDHKQIKDDEFYKGEFLVTQLRHTFSQDERRHTMYMNVMKDSIPVEFKNVAVSSEPVNAKSQVINY